MPFLDLTRAGALEFQAPAWDDFPCLGLAYRALEAERSLPIVLNAANEVAVASFLEGTLVFRPFPSDRRGPWTRTGRRRSTRWPRSGRSTPGPARLPRSWLGR